MRPSPPGSSASLALPLVLVLLAAVAPAVQADAGAAASAPGDGASTLQADGSGQETVRYTVEAHDVGPDAAQQGDYWFTWNVTGSVRNPPALLPAGAKVVITFVNRGAQQHNLHIGGGIDVRTDLLASGESTTLNFTVPEDAPTSFSYWCDPHRQFGMEGNATSSRQRYQELTTETLNVTGHDEGSNYWFTTERFGENVRNPPILLKPGFTYVVNFTNAGSVEHNFHVGAPINRNTTLIPGGASETITFTVPSNASGTLSYWCDPHRNLGMQGTVYTNQTAFQQAAEGLLGGEEHIEIEALGVDYLAYWVGVIAFALLFVVYGLYFFLFKYETGTTTDHKDRAGGPGGEHEEWTRTVGWILFLTTVATVFVLAAAELGHI